jgi:hypothetical protein
LGGDSRDNTRPTRGIQHPVACLEDHMRKHQLR